MKNKDWIDSSNSPFNNPFAALKSPGDTAQSSFDIDTSTHVTAVKEDGDWLEKIGKNYSANIEKKGRGGKTVTVLRLKKIDTTHLPEITQFLKKKLGVGGKVETDTIILQGDCRQMLQSLLSP